VEKDGGEGIPVGLLATNVVLVFTLSNTPVEREQEVWVSRLNGSGRIVSCYPAGADLSPEDV
jgi:hypothetical protein